jgi:cytochrome c-type biogenesis protein
MIDERTFAVAFGAGMAATFNPCGFAMLPAYLSYFLGMEDRSKDAQAGVMRALRVGLAVSVGFMVVFFAMGVLFSTFTQSIGEHLPWVTIIIGVGIAVLGVAMLRGFEPILSLPKLQKGTKGRELPSMFLFGVSYAVSSLACSIGLFTTVVATTFTRQSVAEGVIAFLVYALGMALVLMVLTLAIALAKQGLVRSMRRVLPFVNRVAGGLLVVAGAYLVYYGWFERQSNQSPQSAPGGPASTVFKWNAELSNWISQNDPRRIGIVLGAIVAIAVLLATAWRAPARPRSKSR